MLARCRLFLLGFTSRHAFDASTRQVSSGGGLLHGEDMPVEGHSIGPLALGRVGGPPVDHFAVRIPEGRLFVRKRGVTPRGPSADPIGPLRSARARSSSARLHRRWASARRAAAPTRASGHRPIGAHSDGQLRTTRTRRDPSPVRQAPTGDRRHSPECAPSRCPRTVAGSAPASPDRRPTPRQPRVGCPRARGGPSVSVAGGPSQTAVDKATAIHPVIQRAREPSAVSKGVSRSIMPVPRTRPPRSPRCPWRTPRWLDRLRTCRSAPRSESPLPPTSPVP